MKRASIFLAIALGSVAYAEPKRAPEATKPQPPPKPGTRRIVAILEVRVSEGVPAEVAQQFQRDLDKMIDPQHYWLATRARVHELLTNSTRWTDGCVIGPCLSEVHTQTGADVALVAALSGSGTSFGSVITIVRTDNGHVLSQEAARCDVCTLNEALAAAEKASIKLLDALPSHLPDEAAGHRAAVADATQPLESRITDLEQRTNHGTAGTTLLVVGLAAATAGLVAYKMDNHASYGVGLAGAGAGVALGGVVVLTF